MDSGLPGCVGENGHKLERRLGAVIGKRGKESIGRKWASA